MRKQICVALMSLAVSVASTSMAHASTLTLYNSEPSPLPGNEPSEGYQCCQVRQLGQGVDLTSGGTYANFNVEVLMSNWALESTYEPVGTSLGYTVPLTLNLFNVGPGNAVGSLIATLTTPQFIPWRPESGGCSDPTAYLSSVDGKCYHGLLTPVEFNFGTLTVPNQLIYGLAFNTQTVGYSPTGVSGPYNSLNQGLTFGGSPSVGSVFSLGSLYVDGQTCYPYDGTNNTGACADGPDKVFRINGGWEDEAGTPYNPSALITADAVPEPTSLILLGTGVAGIASRIRKRVARKQR